MPADGRVQPSRKNDVAFGLDVEAVRTGPQQLQPAGCDDLPDRGTLDEPASAATATRGADMALGASTPHVGQAVGAAAAETRPSALNWPHVSHS